jgi:large subunit ribosomal protein L13
MYTMKTFSARKNQVARKWYLIDAQDKILGRIAARAALILRGKHKPTFTPHVDMGDGVIIINVATVRVTGAKRAQKIYRRFSGYPGGLREVTLENMLKKRPTTVMKLAVRRMLPQGPLGRDILKRLRVYADDKHAHSSQKPISLDIQAIAGPRHVPL